MTRHLQIRQQDHWLTETLIAGEAIDIREYDRFGRIGENGRAMLCRNDEVPQFLFLQSADEGRPVNVAFCDCMSGQYRCVARQADPEKEWQAATLDDDGNIVDEANEGNFSHWLSEGTICFTHNDVDEYGASNQE